MAALYSTRFLAQAGLSGTGTSYVVPAGKVAVIKQVTIYLDPSFGVARAFLEDGATGAALFSGGTNIGTPAWFGFYGAIVVNPGDSFHFQVNATAGDAGDVYCGGYLLSLP